MSVPPSPSVEQTITCRTTSIDTVGVNLVDIAKGTAVLLPAGNAITSIEVQRRNATLLDPDGGQSITVGILGVAGANASFTVAGINTYNWMGATLPSQIGVAAATNIQVLATVGNITAGSLYVVIKYKPIATGERKY